MFPIMKKVVNGLICHGLYHVQYEEIQRLEQYEKCLLCPSHSNIFDPFFLFPKTDNMFIMAKSEIFRYKWLTKIFKHYQVFPIKRGKNDVKGIKTVLELFENQEKIKLLMFPEGGILKDNRIHRNVKDGAVFLAATLTVPIIPIFITSGPKPFSKVVVKIGEPIQVGKEVLENKEQMKQVSNQLINTIYEM